ncbi:MAG: YwiC-like family protein [Leptolyngbya sp. SIOISBB]|nr:YwiC-like family protein [Leptolyngbya sp. SIOISBB]
MTTIAPQTTPHAGKPWYLPTLSPEHGVYVMLAVSFLTGVAAAQHWTVATTLALIGAYCGFQAEHPLSLQIKQRRSWKPRYLVWLGVYGGIAMAIALGLLWHSAQPGALGILYGAVGVAVMVDGLAIWQRQQKSVWNELIAFAATCAAAPLAYVVTTGTLTPSAIGLWLLNALFFSSAIFTVKLRKARTASVTAGVAFHAIATGLMVLLWQGHWLAPITAAAFGIALLKFGLILWQRDWYCNTQIQSVAMLETAASFLFLVVAALSQLPAHLS